MSIKWGPGDIYASFNWWCDMAFIEPMHRNKPNITYSFNWVIIPAASTKLIGGYTGITLSVCPSVDRIVSALYLQQYSSDPFHICTSYQATSEGVSRVMPISKFKNLKFWRIFKICNFDFVIFWLWIQYDSMVWVIMRRRGVSSERRRSSCSSLTGSSLMICFYPRLWHV